ncbi:MULTISPECIES: efflux RND transporter periplasmic adaptor subunit [Olivibacter]|uniref:Efflux RND transporter periplasmic adaptor subunit n=1 Tax=Olivibacter oleidegradans TaxID=760123 RepID=A0ABV6HRA6_9SPHI|nr:MULTISPECIES: efflux RND transporter periplasmic adaptor subunit [Olivibacter]QEL03968.1 efflux RND transporter periplasmic adaptor subunit [Olivibacter sp. LS-1]
MRKNFINKRIVLFYLTALIISCRQEKPDQVPSKGHEQHGKSPVDASLQSLLKPVNEQIKTSISTTKADSGIQVLMVEVPGKVTLDTRNNTSISSRVGGRIEKLYIKYNYQPVRRGQLIMQIYSPELVSAQRELLLLKGNKMTNEQLYNKAINKLRFLGLTQQQINSILQKGQPDYRVSIYSPADGYILEKGTSPAPVTAAALAPSIDGGMEGMSRGNSMSLGNATSTPTTATTTPLILREGQYISVGQGLFNIYTNRDLIAEFSIAPQLATMVKLNARILYNSTANPGKSYLDRVELLEPTYRAGENFTLARVYGATTNLRVGELLRGKIPTTITSGWWLPKQAVLKLGSRSIVFKKQGSVFVPTEVKSGVTVNGQVQILNNIGEWSVAENAYYLVDSESFIITQKDS